MAAALAPLESIADVVTLDGTDPFDGGGRGRQWFSISGVTEQDRPLRVAEALPALLTRLDELASSRSLAREDMVVLGFSQGAIMTLAMVAQGLHPGRAIAIAGRLASSVVEAGNQASALLLIHDGLDRVMPATLSDEAGARLSAAGHSVKLIRTDGNGHGIGPSTIKAIAEWLNTTDAFRANSNLIEG
jgi:phospholipase/carboxylesterase